MICCLEMEEQRDSVRLHWSKSDFCFLIFYFCFLNFYFCFLISDICFLIQDFLLKWSFALRWKKRGTLWDCIDQNLSGSDEPPDEIVMQPALYFPPNIEHNSPLQILHKNKYENTNHIWIYPSYCTFSRWYGICSWRRKKLVAGSVLENVIPTGHDFQNFETHPLIAVCRF